MCCRDVWPQTQRSDSGGGDKEPGTPTPRPGAPMLVIGILPAPMLQTHPCTAQLGKWNLNGWCSGSPLSSSDGPQDVHHLLPLTCCSAVVVERASLPVCSLP